MAFTNFVWQPNVRPNAPLVPTAESPAPVIAPAAGGSGGIGGGIARLSSEQIAQLQAIYAGEPVTNPVPVISPVSGQPIQNSILQPNTTANMLVQESAIATAVTAAPAATSTTETVTTGFSDQTLLLLLLAIAVIIALVAS